MSDLSSIAGNKNVLKGQLRRLSLEQLYKLSEVSMQIIEEKEEAERDRLALEQEKQRKLDEIRQAMADAGLSADDLHPAKRRGRPRKSADSE
ncbi:H-NS histone family protein [Kushneria sinocarnis]|uniref:H-NS histone family protein n=1 Tax=Kushneria sinocarnis TaxID=595502 RepID=A0A420WUI4_9GAMM|nr:H-NS family nucleoid-associated regulatory protein [Kushneria sinocarnis]RKQ97106.1 H-NS histone family protein [Kushneria sinocarnis]